MAVLRKDFRRIRIVFVLVICLAQWLPARQVEAREGVLDLLSLSIEDLMEIEVTSVSRRSQRLSKTPAPVTVLISEDIRGDRKIKRRSRSGNE